jgi:hypothetical protein
MTFFNPDILWFHRKASAFAIQDCPGLWRIHWRIGNQVILSTFYTRHDQACLLWGILSGLIFFTAQFLPISWTVQAIASSVLSVAGVGGMAALTYAYSKLERLGWVLHTWIYLILFGLLLTDLGIFCGIGQILIHICPLWLGLSAIGYGCTGIGMRSRTFILASLIHAAAIPALSWVGGWQPLTTGIVISLTVILIAELQWDAHGVCGHTQPLQSAQAVQT